MAKEYRVFLSGVSSEFEQARVLVARDLSARNITVRTQESFRHEPGGPTLLQLLHEYIRDCHAVVCIHGARSGDCPPEPNVAQFADMLPGHMTRASFTQWEFLFSRHYEKHILVFRATGDYRPGRPDGIDIPGLQQQFLHY